MPKSDRPHVALRPEDFAVLQRVSRAEDRSMASMVHRILVELYPERFKEVEQKNQRSKTNGK